MTRFMRRTSPQRPRFTGTASCLAPLSFLLLASAFGCGAPGGTEEYASWEQRGDLARPVAPRAPLSSTVSDLAAAPTAEPPAVSSATVSAVLADIAGDDTQGRQNLTAGGALARTRLQARLEAWGLHPAGDSPGVFTQTFDAGINLLGIYYPPGTEKQAPKVLLGAHYDHLGTGCTARPEASSSYCNGAADNAGGVAAVMSALEALIAGGQGPVAVALWDAEEDGLLGSEWFAANASFDTSALRLYINLDIVGLGLYRGGERLQAVLGAESGGATLASDVDASIAGLPNETFRLSYAFGNGRSDMTSFVEAGYKIPFVFLTDGDGSIYHTTADELQYLHTDKVISSANLVARLAARALARTYTWAVPYTLPTYADAPSVMLLASRFLNNAQSNSLTAAQKRDLAARVSAVDRIVKAGASAFTTADAYRLVSVLLFTLDLSRSLTFVP